MKDRQEELDAQAIAGRQRIVDLQEARVEAAKELEHVQYHGSASAQLMKAEREMEPAMEAATRAYEKH